MAARVDAQIVDANMPEETIALPRISAAINVRKWAILPRFADPRPWATLALDTTATMGISMKICPHR